MKELIEQIQRATEEELRDFLHAAEKRYAALYPDWEVVYLALPKAPDQRKAQLARILDFLERNSSHNGLLI